MTDIEIFDGILNNSGAAWREIYLIVRPRIMRAVVQRFGRDMSENLEDIFQEACVALLKDVHEGRIGKDDRLNVSGWIFTFCVRAAIKAAKKAGKKFGGTEWTNKTESGERGKNPKENEKGNPWTVNVEDPEQKEKELKKRDDFIDRMLASLPKNCRDILKLHYWDKMPMDEIAGAVGLKGANTAKATKHRCMEKFKELVSKAVESEEIEGTLRDAVDRSMIRAMFAEFREEERMGVAKAAFAERRAILSKWRMADDLRAAADICAAEAARACDADAASGFEAGAVGDYNEGPACESASAVGDLNAGPTCASADAAWESAGEACEFEAGAAGEAASKVAEGSFAAAGGLCADLKAPAAANAYSEVTPEACNKMALGEDSAADSNAYGAVTPEPHIPGEESAAANAKDAGELLPNGDADYTDEDKLFDELFAKEMKASGLLLEEPAGQPGIRTAELPDCANVAAANIVADGIDTPASANAGDTAVAEDAEQDKTAGANAVDTDNSGPDAEADAGNTAGAEDAGQDETYADGAGDDANSDIAAGDTSKDAGQGRTDGTTTGKHKSLWKRLFGKGRGKK